MSQNERHIENDVVTVRNIKQWIQNKGSDAARFGARYWRRSSTRALGLFFNGIERVNEMVLG